MRCYSNCFAFFHIVAQCECKFICVGRVLVPCHLCKRFHGPITVKHIDSLLCIPVKNRWLWEDLIAIYAYGRSIAFCYGMASSYSRHPFWLARISCQRGWIQSYGHMSIPSIYYFARALQKVCWCNQCMKDVGSQRCVQFFCSPSLLNKLWEFDGTSEGCWARTRWNANTIRGPSKQHVHDLFHVGNTCLEDQTPITF